jgi:hypothetical protein
MRIEIGFSIYLYPLIALIFEKAPNLSKMREKYVFFFILIKKMTKTVVRLSAF